MLKLGDWRGFFYFPVNMGHIILVGSQGYSVLSYKPMEFFACHLHKMEDRWKRLLICYFFSFYMRCVSCRENGVELILPLIDRRGERWLWWMSLGHQWVPDSRRLHVSAVPGACPLRNQDNCPFDPLSHHHLAPPLTSSGRTYLPLKVNQQVQHQQIPLSQSSAPNLSASTFLTRLWTTSIWYTEAWVFIHVSEKREQKFSLD